MRPLIKLFSTLALVLSGFLIPVLTVWFAIYMDTNFIHASEVGRGALGFLGFLIGVPAPVLIIEFLANGRDSVINQLYVNFLNTEEARVKQIEEKELALIVRDKDRNWSE